MFTISESSIRSMHMFSVKNYDICSIRIEAHLSYLHDMTWDVTENGPIIIKIKSIKFLDSGGAEIGEDVQNDKKEYAASERKIHKEQ